MDFQYWLNKSLPNLFQVLPFSKVIDCFGSTTGILSPFPLPCQRRQKGKTQENLTATLTSSNGIKLPENKYLYGFLNLRSLGAALGRAPGPEDAPASGQQKRYNSRGGGGGSGWKRQNGSTRQRCEAGHLPHGTPQRQATG